MEEVIEALERELRYEVAYWWHENETGDKNRHMKFIDGSIYGLSRALQMLHGDAAFQDDEIMAWWNARVTEDGRATRRCSNRMARLLGLKRRNRV